MISPSTHTEPQFETNPRIVSLSREIEVGASGDDSRGCTESGGGVWPDAGANAVIGAPCRVRTCAVMSCRARVRPASSVASVESQG